MDDGGGGGNPHSSIMLVCALGGVMSMSVRSLRRGRRGQGSACFVSERVSCHGVREVQGERNQNNVSRSASLVPRFPSIFSPKF